MYVNLSDKSIFDIVTCRRDTLKIISMILSFLSVYFLFLFFFYTKLFLLVYSAIKLDQARISREKEE